MKILIHGRKNGYTVLYPKPTPIEFYSFASDIQSISANNYEVYYGKNFYTLAFVDGGCVYTKYVIGDDVERGQLGEIGISVYIPNTQKLSGSDVKTLLDELINTYCRNYISDNKIDEPKNGFDWPLFNALANGYNEKLLSRSSIDDIFKIGTKEPAFHYFKSDSELIELLDKPFQEEYSDYKQILFIDTNLQGAANPLNALKNSGFEVNPDLNNEYYYLISDNRSKEIYITADGKPRSNKKGENHIRAKWHVEIKYSKDDRCYEPINVPGTLSDLSTEIHNYIEINGNHIMLKYDAFDNPKKRVKPVTFKIKDRNKNDIDGAVITYQTDNESEQKTTDYTIPFKGDEIIKRWIVSARINDCIYSEKEPVTPENKNESVVLTLHEHKLIEFRGELKDGNDSQYFTDIKISIQTKNIFNQKPECDFVDDEINKPFKVTATYSDIRETLQGEKEFWPKDVKLVIIELKKSSQQKPKFYDLDMGGWGIPSAGYSNSETGNDISVTVKTKGYVFKGFKLDKNRKRGTYDGTLVAQYEKQKTFAEQTIIFFSKPSGIVTSLISTFILGIGIWALCYFLDNDKQSKETPLTAQQIIDYIEGDSLMLDKLNAYKTKWGNQDGDKNIDESIQQAITKRTKINEKKFSELKYEDFKKSKPQQDFINIILKIDTTKYSEVSSRLGNVSNLTLTQIAEKINEIMKLNEPTKEDTPQKPDREENKPEQKKETPAVAEQSKALPKEDQRTAKPSNQQENKTNEIIQYIKGSELDKKKLVEYKNTKGISPNLKNSIQLCVDFWDLDGIGTDKKAKTYTNFLVKLNADDNFDNSKLKAFVEKMCQEGGSSSYSKQNKIKGLK